MKILAIEIETDLGRRRVQLTNHVEIDPKGEMPRAFVDLMSLAWGLIHDVGTGEIKPPRNEA